MPDRYRVVQTRGGEVRGQLIKTEDGAALEFRGIPYASIPGRFQPAAPLLHWETPIIATRSGAIAPQTETPDFALRSMDEWACLNLNLWSGAPGESALPVLVWVHGGLHISGSNDQPMHNGARLAAFGRMIVVTINYRLGALGHLPLNHLLGDAYSESSNAALGDVITSLEWIQRFVSSFGGDPHNVTLAGQSAGGALVASLMASPRATGLFRRAIIQSGSVERPVPVSDGREIASELLHRLGIDRQPEKLVTISWSDLVAAQQHVIEKHNEHSVHAVPVFRPFVDGQLLPQFPSRAIAEGASSDVDLLIGTNANEATAMVDVREPNGPELRALVERYLDVLASEYRASVDVIDSVAESLAQSGSAPLSFAQALESCITELIYAGPTRRFVASRRESSAPTRSYRFEWGASDERWARRAGHSLEIPFVFRHTDDSPAAVAEVGRSAPASLRDELSGLWCEFARHGFSGPRWAALGPNPIVFGAKTSRR